jgi:hypothetical protein
MNQPTCYKQGFHYFLGTTYDSYGWVVVRIASIVLQCNICFLDYVFNAFRLGNLCYVGYRKSCN